MSLSAVMIAVRCVLARSAIKFVYAVLCVGALLAPPIAAAATSVMRYLPVYNSGLVGHWVRGCWEDAEGALQTNFAAAAPGRAGTAIEVRFGPNNGWNAFGLDNRAPDWTTLYWLYLNEMKTIEFDVYFEPDATGVENLSLVVDDAGLSSEPVLVSLIPGWAAMTNAQRYGHWLHATARLPSLSITIPRFHRFLLFNGADGGISQPHFRVAAVKLGWQDDTKAPVLSFQAAAPNLNDTQLALTFATDEPTIYRVDYGLTTNYGAAVQNLSDWSTNHTATLKSLTPGATYYYRITAKDHRTLGTAVPNQGTLVNSYSMPAVPTTPPVIGGLSVSGVEGHKAVLAWNTNRPCRATLSYRKAGGTPTLRMLSDYTQTRSAALDLLEPATKYTAAITVVDAFANRSTTSLVLTTTATSTADVNVVIDPVTTHSISPWIYGINFHDQVAGVPPRLTLNREGGNRWTAYNWENNASNSGTDWGPYSNDGYLGGGDVPAEAVRGGIAADRSQGRASLMTVQLQGYVAADKNGLVNISDPAYLAKRFKRLVYRKGAAFTATPNPADGVVYADEFLWTLASKLGAGIFAADAPLPTFVSLDNEPELWSSTHDDIQPALIAPPAYIRETIDLARALKDVAPGVKLFGPVHYGFGGIVDWQNSAGFSSTYWFMDKYLQELKAASNAYGKRLLDAYDLHWYSEAQSADGARVTSLNGANLTDAQVQAIVQSPRSLWDNTYTENSWITQYLGGPVQLLTRLQAKIDADWPGTRLAITEYGNGGDNHIAGTIAQADNLGIFGSRDVYAATLWPLNASSPFILAGFRMFRGFDGVAADFGDLSIKATSSDAAKVAAYVSRDTRTTGRVIIVAINRSSVGQDVAFRGLAMAGTASVFRIDAGSSQAQINAHTPVQPVLAGRVAMHQGGTGDWVIYLPPLSVSTIEVK